MDERIEETGSVQASIGEFIPSTTGEVAAIVVAMIHCSPDFNIDNYAKREAVVNAINEVSAALKK